MPIIPAPRRVEKGVQAWTPQQDSTSKKKKKVLYTLNIYTKQTNKLEIPTAKSRYVLLTGWREVAPQHLILVAGFSYLVSVVLRQGFMEPAQP